MTLRSDNGTGKRRFVGRAPGRLDLMGGNASYTGGLVAQATIAAGTWATVELRDDAQIALFNPQMQEIGWDEQAEFSINELTGADSVRQLVEGAQGMHWTGYILGAFYLLKDWFPDRITRGASIYIKSEIPMGKGAGSSTALVVSVMKTAAFAYGVELAGVELAAACQWVESVVAESACGMVDQIAVVAGEEGCLLPVICQPCQPEALVQLPEELEIWAVEVGRPATSAAEQEAARVAAFLGYKMICDWEGLAVQPDEDTQAGRWKDERWNGYLANVKPSLFRSNYELRLPETLTGAEYLQAGQIHVDAATRVRPEVSYRVRACTRFAVEENQRVRLFLELARAASGFEQMGELMYQSHYAYTECGLGCEPADLIVSLVCEEEPASGLYGARIAGAGAEGPVAVLGRKDAAGALLRVIERLGKIHRGAPYIFEGSSMGADRFGVLTLEG